MEQDRAEISVGCSYGGTQSSSLLRFHSHMGSVSRLWVRAMPPAPLTVSVSPTGAAEDPGPVQTEGVCGPPSAPAGAQLPQPGCGAPCDLEAHEATHAGRLWVRCALPYRASVSPLASPLSLRLSQLIRSQNFGDRHKACQLAFS